MCVNGHLSDVGLGLIILAVLRVPPAHCYDAVGVGAVAPEDDALGGAARGARGQLLLLALDGDLLELVEGDAEGRARGNVLLVLLILSSASLDL